MPFKSSRKPSRALSETFVLVFDLPNKNPSRRLGFDLFRVRRASQFPHIRSNGPHGYRAREDVLTCYSHHCGVAGSGASSFMLCLANQLLLDRHSVCLGFGLDADVSVRALHRNLTDGSSGFYVPPVQADRRFIALRSRCLRMVKSASVASRSRS